ncbi:IPT/TIG domain-containing protein [Catalinimonas alkaloidigena]|uniref:IPT/TIG domain-containing protein n=1 Tax=Catalinimonas alkaloidigena TaxID=1075417 RepID=UPI0015A00779
MVWYPPQLHGISKDTSRVGEVITLSGENFAQEPSRNVVRFGTVAGKVLTATTDQVAVQVPENVQSGVVSIETPGGVTDSPRPLVIIPHPVLLSFTPPQGSVGTTVTLKGQAFGTYEVANTVWFGPWEQQVEAQVTKATDSTLEVRVPKGAQTGTLTITGVGGRSTSSSVFTVDVLPPLKPLHCIPTRTGVPSR